MYGALPELIGAIVSESRSGAVRQPPPVPSPSPPPPAAHLKVESATGLLVGVRQVLSPHFNARPPQMLPELIVVHGISLPPGEFGGPWIDRLFTGTLPWAEHAYFRQIEGLKASAHVVIDRDGRLTQYVPFTERAWHAGVSEYRTRTGCNDFSIGIELEGTETIPYTDAQYASLLALILALLAAYPSLAPQHITGHSDIAPGRKTDPGPSFDWPRLRAALSARLGAQP
jgi:AmpD protein